MKRKAEELQAWEQALQEERERLEVLKKMLDEREAQLSKRETKEDTPLAPTPHPPPTLLPPSTTSEVR